MIRTLKDRGVPALLDREKMLSILLEEEYGHLPEAPPSISFKTTNS